MADPVETDNPLPTVTDISPASKTAHLPTFTLTVNGSGFVSSSKIVFNGEEKSTTYENSTQLSCSIAPDDIPASTSTQAAHMRGNGDDTTVSVLVRSPSPGGGDSSAVDFTIRSDHDFSAPQQVPTGSLSVSYPVIAAGENGNVAVMFQSYDADTEVYALTLLHSQDGGASWSSPVNTVETTQTTTRPMAHRMTMDANGYIHMVFFAEYSLYYMRSTDGGTTWGSPSQLPLSSTVSLQTAITVDSGNGINILCIKDDVEGHYPVYFIRSTDDGESFSAAADVFADWESYYLSYSPTLGVDDNGGIFAAWTIYDRNNQSSIVTNYSHDNGATWGAADTYLGLGRTCDLAMDPSGNPGLLTATGTTDASAIMWHGSSDSGVVWNTPAEVAAANTANSVPSMKIDGAGNININYLDGSTCRFQRSTDGGATWSTAVDIADTGSIFRVNMALDSVGNIYMIYKYPDTGALYMVRSQ